MNSNEVGESIIQMLVQTGEAHHDAFLATNGEDPQWASWYAHDLKPKLDALLSQTLTESEITLWLVAADRAHASDSPDEPWAPFYACYIIDQLHLE